MNIIVYLMMISSILLQSIGIAILPITKGFTQIIPTIISITSFCLSIFLMARISYAGVSLSLFVPLLAAGIPMASIAVGVLVYGEPASMAKLGTLFVACILIGTANNL